MTEVLKHEAAKGLDTKQKVSLAFLSAMMGIVAYSVLVCLGVPARLDATAIKIKERSVQAESIQRQSEAARSTIQFDKRGRDRLAVFDVVSNGLGGHSQSYWQEAIDRARAELADDIGALEQFVGDGYPQLSTIASGHQSHLRDEDGMWLQWQAVVDSGGNDEEANRKFHAQLLEVKQSHAAYVARLHSAADQLEKLEDESELEHLVLMTEIDSALRDLSVWMLFSVVGVCGIAVSVWGVFGFPLPQRQASKIILPS